jgi:hypothetical protein
VRVGVHVCVKEGGGMMHQGASECSMSHKHTHARTRTHLACLP